ncbi:MAG: hypothetical protein ACRETY_02455, partial [Steroidobacteraceae bacterium]
MTRIPVAVAALLAAIAAGAQDIPFVPGQGSAEQLNDTERSVARAAIRALAAELQVPEDRIQVDTIRAVEWPDSSIGCPQPGRAYLQVITPGHKVTLRAEGQVHVVHEAKGSAFVCEKTRPYAGINPKGELVFGSAMLEARRDLASKLGVPDSEVQMTGAKEQTWDDAGLGCPEPGKSHPPGKVTGWVLTLAHGKREFT